MIKLAPAGLKDDIEMRKVYAGFVAGQIEAGSPIIALEADLMSSMAMDSVARDYPQHVINCGIMEANVIGTAAGLALTGRKPFVHTFTAFASRRCFDQLFMALDYQRNNVKVIASDAGVTACHNGGTHMSFEDMGIVRGLAHSVVLEVTDAVMFADILRQLMDLDGFTGYVPSVSRRGVSMRQALPLPLARATYCARAMILRLSPTALWWRRRWRRRANWSRKA
ncbi:transketolase domain protein [Salmonella enterica subsp. enterica serovar Montevideo str. 531954]|nr:transketolase domain protein [Salmonella enterica subsp. enterica serovar Montevideo str. 531954]